MPVRRFVNAAVPHWKPKLLYLWPIAKVFSGDRVSYSLEWLHICSASKEDLELPGLLTPSDGLIAGTSHHIHFYEVLVIKLRLHLHAC